MAGGSAWCSSSRDGSTGEQTALESFGDRVVWHTAGEGFTWETQDKARDIAACQRAWGIAEGLMDDPAINLVVLDELNIALRYDYLPLEDVVARLKSRRDGLHVIVTGRNAKPDDDRGGRSRHRDGRGKTSFLRRRENPGRHRILMAARVLMFQGTGSDVGKSLIVAGLCRLLANRGMAVRPFKPQNMSNNAAVTSDGGEIGRAQALQARAARVAPSVDMNPVLLKPQSEVGSQIVVQGKVCGTAKAREYQARKPELMPYVLDSFARLRGGLRHRAGRGRGLGVRSQSARQRHRQYGFCARRGCAGRF